MRPFTLLFIFILILSSCSAPLNYISTPSLQKFSDKNRLGKIMVSNRGDWREARPDKLGWGFSLFLPLRWHGRFPHDETFTLSGWIAEGLSHDLSALGHPVTKRVEEIDYAPMSNLLAEARSEKCDYLITVHIKEAKLFYAGFTFIPFFTPMRIKLVVMICLYDVSSGLPLWKEDLEHREWVWKGWKVLIVDTPLDALWVKKWLQDIYGEQVVPEINGEACEIIVKKLDSIKEVLEIKALIDALRRPIE